jgi:hypothetical protein
VITSLNEDQLAQIPVYRDRWLEIGLRTEVLDFAEAKTALAKCYTSRDLEAPSNVYYATGPADAFKIYKSVKPGGTSTEFMNSMIYGAHDSSWLSFYAYFKEVCGLDLEIVQPLIEYAQVACWTYVDKDFAIIIEFPMYIRFDDQNRLHCEDGPAIEYQDGTMVFAWHGVRLSRDKWFWITDKKELSAKAALKEDNLELRRVACEILGWVHILKELKSKVIDQDEDPQIGTLLQVNIPDIGKEQFLRVVCGTGREFAIPVPPTVKTALEANAWTYGVDPEVLRDLEFRT